MTEYTRGAVPTHQFTSETDVAEAIEIQLKWSSTASEHVRDTIAFNLTAWRNDQRGTVGYSLVRPGSSTQNALSSVQSKSFFPGKAKPGWQLQVIDFAAAGLYEIAHIW